jgi:membrane fusion protein, heavy metal efflux system
MKLISISAFTVSLIFIVSCGHTKTAEPVPTSEDQLIEITHQQFESEKMSLGSPTPNQFTETVTCNGHIISLPSATAVINSPLAGLVKSIYCKPGQKVKKGDEMFELAGNELIELQTNLNESAGELMKAKSEFERIKSLFNENVGTEKELILAESANKSAFARYSALKMKLQLIGLNVSDIENSKYYNSFTIKAPISGYITKINLSIGQYVDLQTNMTEIIDNTKLQLLISVFEKDINKLKSGQKINFHLLGDDRTSWIARLDYIGKNVEPDTRAIDCFASIDNAQKPGLVNNAFVEATIITGTDTVNSVPEGALIKSEGNNYILVLEKEEDNSYFFKKLRVKTGRSNNGFVEIKDEINNTRILSEGAYNMNVE